ncbi:MAG TPA: hypothetical protein VFH51_15655 [Myxococcota bacterium]|nr:hypothetical protein [Myxococcota bacterium]
MATLRAAVRKTSFLASTIVVAAVIWLGVEALGHTGYGWPAVVAFYFIMLAMTDD